MAAIAPTLSARLGTGRRRSTVTTSCGTRAVVVGDTPHDVRGALDADALAVGVASGKDTADDLREAGAHIVLASLADFMRLL